MRKWGILGYTGIVLLEAGIRLSWLTSHSRKHWGRENEKKLKMTSVDPSAFSTLVFCSELLIVNWCPGVNWSVHGQWAASVGVLRVYRSVRHARSLYRRRLPIQGPSAVSGLWHQQGRTAMGRSGPSFRTRSQTNLKSSRSRCQIQPSFSCSGVPGSSWWYQTAVCTLHPEQDLTQTSPCPGLLKVWQCFGKRFYILMVQHRYPHSLEQEPACPILEDVDNNSAYQRAPSKAWLVSLRCG